MSRAALLLFLLCVGLLILYYQFAPVVRRDVTKFRGWRERVRKWKTRNVVPPAEYRRDNRLWTIRITGLLVSVAGMVALGVLIFGPERLSLGGWSVAAATVISLAGAAIWGGMDNYVR